ncbi:TetR/AcrR family transcriptional regulator [Dinghuibacter silviterrae]|uniref:TetR family transcriptional regulator n=1 Tax=Dinghuibacter silviterrae TaxID=1539049 RepID=A0A4R8DFW7_9BACT|nr:TetR family transcriptional regulator [Dinghuibacter silviterrae]TDW96134.1 TetR family transcriptional regulator [Dinghuibacter silviterrae]
MATEGKPKKAPAKKPRAPKDKDQSTEERIKEAARKLFTQKGFAATRTRDIAEEAGINLALLNYYFRNKEKLFNIIMWENMQLFLGVILQNMENKNMTMEEMLSFVADAYINMLLKNPDLPFFVLSNIANDPSGEINNSGFMDRLSSLRNTFFARFGEAAQKGEFKDVHPLHLMANLMGMIIFPFLGKRLLTFRFGLSEEEFVQLMEERKKMIPGWMMRMSAA